MNTETASERIGTRVFTDGIDRNVYEDAARREYVINGDGEPVA